MNKKLNIDEVMNPVPPWSPHVLTSVNDYDVKVANADGDFVDHVHEETDEFFLVLSGRFHIDMPEGTVSLEPNDVFTVPRGVRHRPRAEPGTRILMFEPRGTVNTGDPSTGTTGIRVDDS